MLGVSRYLKIMIGHISEKNDGALDGVDLFMNNLLIKPPTIKS